MFSPLHFCKTYLLYFTFWQLDQSKAVNVGCDWHKPQVFFDSDTNHATCQDSNQIKSVEIGAAFGINLNLYTPVMTVCHLIESYLSTDWEYPSPKKTAISVDNDQSFMITNTWRDVKVFNFWIKTWVYSTALGGLVGVDQFVATKVPPTTTRPDLQPNFDLVSSANQQNQLISTATRISNNMEPCHRGVGML